MKPRPSNGGASDAKVLVGRSLRAVLLVSLCLSSAAIAQEPAPTPAPAPSAAAPTPVPAGEIGGAAERIANEMRTARDVIAKQGNIDDIAPPFEQTRESFVAQVSDVRSRLGSGLQLRELLSIEEELGSVSSRVQGWQQVLVGRAAALQGQLERLDDLEKVWKATSKDAHQEQLPPATIGLVDTTLKDIAQKEVDARERRSAVLSLQGQMSSLQTDLSEALSKVSAAHTALRESLFTFDSAPLWTALTAEPESGDGVDAALQAWTAELQVGLGWIRAHAVALTLYVLAIAALAVVLLRIGQGTQEWIRSDPALETSLRLVERPLSTALVIGIVAGRWIFPDRPSVLVAIASMILLVSVLRLLPANRTTGGAAGLYGLAAVAVVGRIADFAPVWSFGQRLLILVESAALLGWLVWISAAPRLNGMAFSRFLRMALRIGTRLGVALLAVAVCANVAGNVKLADFVTTVVFGSSAAAVLLAVLKNLITGVFELLLRSRALGGLRSVRHRRIELRRWLDRILQFVAVLAWVITTLALLGVYDNIASGVTTFLGKTGTVGNLSISTGSVVVLILAIWLTIRLSRVTGALLEEDVLPRLRLPRGIPYAAALVARYSVIALGLLIAVSAAGLDLSKLALVLGALGVGIGLGLQNVVSNFVSGLILLFERPIQVGDTVERGPLMGEVKRIGIRSSTVRTSHGAEVIVPNDKLIAEEVINWTLSDRQRLVDIPVGVAYGCNPRDVLELLLSVARAHPEALKQPEPVVFFLAFGDNSLNFSLRVWIDRFEDGMRIKSELGLAVYDALTAAGIEIPFPQRDVHLRSIEGRMLNEITERLGPKRSSES